jgi:hypothetical protein
MLVLISNISNIITIQTIIMEGILINIIYNTNLLLLSGFIIKNNPI